VLTITSDDIRQLTIGVSTKQCNNNMPTNAQLYFTTARGFSKLLLDNNITVSEAAVRALRQFCGDEGFRPSDDTRLSGKRLTDPRRYFWEEIDAVGRLEWEKLFSSHQDAISRLLFQKAYINDPFVPDYLVHKTRSAASWNETEIAIYSIQELVTLSRAYQGFATREYSVRKGRHKDPAGVTHLAPRFGVIQMQRGGQKQHPEQLQFNLAAGYFYRL
jgi:predicted transcriptional regulator